MITHLVHLPAAPLAERVEQLWLVRAVLPQPWRQMLLPDGAFVVIFNLGEPQKLCDRADVRRHSIFRASWVSGQQPRPIVIEQAGRCHLVGIRFRPGAAAALFRFSLAELTGRVLELEDLWGGEAASVRQQLGDLADDRAVLPRLEQLLARRLRDAAQPDARVTRAAELLRRGGSGVGAIAAHIGLSHKHLVHEFTRRVGLSPKYFGRVHRLQRAVAAIGHRPAVDWAGLAAATGYCDQAHLINEFRELAGLTPTAYLARRSPYVGYLNVA